jgi:hypothetical protein
MLPQCCYNVAAMLPLCKSTNKSKKKGARVGALAVHTLMHAHNAAADKNGEQTVLLLKVV